MKPIIIVLYAFGGLSALLIIVATALEIFGWPKEKWLKKGLKRWKRQHPGGG